MIGIYGLSSQSGLAYFADFLSRKESVIGYARQSQHGKDVVEYITYNQGVNLFRPENKNKEVSKYISLNESKVTNDLSFFIEKAEIIILAIPSHYQMEAIYDLCNNGLKNKNIPIILSPSRTVASPYLWKILGEGHPIICFSTCPYSCKIIDLNTSYIKRRKRTWTASYEGNLSNNQIKLLLQLFPQVTFSNIPAVTSLNNIGAIFHCATYLLNKKEIDYYRENNLSYSFYMQGIAEKEWVGEVLEKVDQIRLQIADCLGIPTFGLKTNPREDVWRKLTNGLRALEEEHKDEIEILRKIRGQFLEYINNCVISSQHWLDITYGVLREPNESLCATIGRTPTYQKNSVPQLRYLEEDIPTGLVPLEALSIKLNIECSIITELIDKYNELINFDIREKGRNLNEFSMEYMRHYLLGK